jgi:hypothetical protein
MILHRFNGVEKFPIRKATMSAYPTEGGVRLSFDVEAENALQTLADTQSLGATPDAEANVDLPALDPEALPGQTLAIFEGDGKGDWLARLYYCEHQALDDNKIEVLARTGNTFEVRWTATTMDVNYYDGSKPATKVEIRGLFTFEQADRWKGRKTAS